MSATKPKKITHRSLRSGLFGFVDLLGFSDRVGAITTVEQLQELERDLTYVQRQFDHKPDDVDIKKLKSITRKRVEAFSDCVVISVPTQSPIVELQGSFDALMSEINGFALAQGESVQRGIFLRGGLDLGFFLQRGSTLISPAMIGAYRLEGTACAPIIAITQRLKDQLWSHPDRRRYSADIDPIKTTFVRAENLPNGESHWMVNYFGVCLGSVEPYIPQAVLQGQSPAAKDRLIDLHWDEACRKWAKGHGDAIIAASQASLESKVRAKYEWLAGYHNREVSRFFSDSGQDLHVHLGPP